MSERNPFDPHSKPAGAFSGDGGRRSLSCEEWEALLADALDGALPPGEDRAFDEHAASCIPCGVLLSQAREGRDWLNFLHPEPELPAGLVERILSKTSGATAERPLAVYGAPIAATPGVLTLPVRRFTPDSRLMMTAAMAFFSIALTLNLAGIRVTSLRLADLTPASIQNNLTRQFFGAKTQVVRYYNNLRVVYEFESRMRELRQDETNQPSRSPQPAGSSKPASENQPPATNRHNGGRLQALPNAPRLAPQGDNALHGHPELASNAIGNPFSGADARPYRPTHTSGVPKHEVAALLAENTNLASTDQAEGNQA